MKKIICFIILTFSLVYLVQSLDRTCKRKKIFDKIKLPLLSSCLVGLISAFVYEESGDSITFSLMFGNNVSNLNKQAVFTDLGNF